MWDVILTYERRKNNNLFIHSLQPGILFEKRITDIDCESTYFPMGLFSPYVAIYTKWLKNKIGTIFYNLMANISAQ